MKVTADDGWAADGLDVANLVEETPWEAAQKGMNEQITWQNDSNQVQ